jgi:hypothetical protein
MNEKSSLIKKFGIPAAVIIGVGVLLYIMFGSSSKTDTTTKAKATGKSISGGGLTSTITDTPVDPIADKVNPSGTSDTTGNAIVSLLRNVSALSLSSNVLESESFKKLSETRVDLPPRNDPGRRNPFSELSGSGTATSINPNTTEMIPKSSLVNPLPDSQNMETNLKTPNVLNQIKKQN